MAGPSSYLDRIVEHHRERARADSRPIGPLLDEARAVGALRGFRRVLSESPGVSVIAEIKRRSPSRGPLRPDLDPATLASRYAAGGATCLSVLTDRPHFGGDPGDLAAARSATRLPVLRKDFTVSERDVIDTRLMGADALLLIVAALDDAELACFADLGRELGLDVLVEAHDLREIERALGAGADMVGVNQRNLKTFEIDRGLAVQVARAIPPGVVRVAESGIRSSGDMTALAGAGYDAALVGESVVTADDPAEAVASLVAASVSGTVAAR